MKLFGGGVIYVGRRGVICVKLMNYLPEVVLFGGGGGGG